MISTRLAAALAFGLMLAGPAAAGTSIVIDASNGEVLSAENPTQAWHPASTTKMMTIYLALKAVRDGKLGLETAIPASKLAASQPRVKVYIKPGQEITLDNALRIMMVKSANDIAYVVAEGVGGDIPTFVGMMNAEAQRLGMRDTRFANPNGWHNPEQQVSARDLAVLAMALMRDFPDYSDYWNTSAIQLGKQVIHNTNGLVGRYSGIGGMKTGFTCPSGFNVVATATRGGRTLIAVVLGAASGAERTVKAAQLLDEGFGKWGGMGYNVASMSPSGTHAYSVCDDIRRRGGGVALADDSDSAGPIGFAGSAAQGGNGDGASDRFQSAFPQPRQAGGMASRTPSGRIVLGQRAETSPIPVAFGRTAGSASAPLAANVTGRPDSRVARSAAPVITPDKPVAASLFGAGSPGLFGDKRTVSGNGAIPGATTAFAPATEAQPPSNAFQTGPLKLQGAVQPGAATAATLRPGVAAGIKPAARPPAKPLLAKPKAEPEKAKPGPAAAKLQPAKPAAKPKAAPKPKSDGDA